MSTKIVRFTLAAPDQEQLARLPGVDADLTVPALYGCYLIVQDLQVIGAGLEDAFLHSTGDAGVADRTRECHLGVAAVGAPADPAHPGFPALRPGLPGLFHLLLKDTSGNGFRPLGIPLAAYCMVGMAGFGAVIMATSSSGPRLAAERSSGWNRQLRVTPLAAWRISPSRC